jgi:hypothetical protein
MGERSCGRCRRREKSLDLTPIRSLHCSKQSVCEGSGVSQLINLNGSIHYQRKKKREEEVRSKALQLGDDRAMAR